MVELKIKQLYLSLIREVSNSAGTEKFIDKDFDLKDYPQTNKILSKGIKNLYKDIVQVLHQATEEEWLQAIKANNHLITPYLKRKLLSAERILAYTDRNMQAMQAFQKRKTNGLNLSERVWRYTNQYKGELELGLDLGIKDGKSADELSRDLRRYLLNPDKLFRRVRDERGELVLSRNAKKYNPGQGVYRSSYKNAMRLTRTEINMAYRTADHEQRSKLDFVVGIEVCRSNHFFDCPVCESLKGKYPKAFKFAGWHPQCRCYTLSILATDDEFFDWINKQYTDEAYALQSKNEVKDVPDNFKNWISNNQERIVKYKSLPYFMNDNSQYVDKGILKERMINELMDKAKSSGDEVFNLAQELAKKYGGYTTPINYKSKESIERKLDTELNGDVSKIKDSVRITVILDKKYIEKSFENIKNNINFTEVKLQTPEKYIGYSGLLSNVWTKNGLIGEVQVNTEKMIYAKEKPKNAKSIIGEKRWNEIRKETGLQGGLGHLYYEEYRITSKHTEKGIKRRKELEKLSNEYYKHFR